MNEFDSLDDFFARAKAGDTYTIPLAEWLSVVPLPEDAPPWS